MQPQGEGDDRAHAAPALDSPVPPTITWSIARLARRTIARLAERRARPGMSPTLIKVPTALSLPGDCEGESK